MNLESHLTDKFEKRLNWKKCLSPYLNYLYPIIRVGLGIKKVNVVSGLENIPINEPALFLPKHRYYADTPVIYKVLKEKKIIANYVMKSALPKIFVPFGAIKVIRFRESIKTLKKLKKTTGKKEFESKIEEIRSEIDSKNEESLDYIKYLYTQNEKVISSPEGTLVETDMGNIRVDDVINATIDAQKYIEEDINLIPIGTKYDRTPIIFRPATIYVEIGKPIKIRDFIEGEEVNKTDLAKKIKEEIARLSGIDVSG